MNFILKFLIVFSFSLCYALEPVSKASGDTIESLAKNIPCPGNKNILLAAFLNAKDTVKIKEFDVFGKPDVYSLPQMLSKSERENKIREYVFFKQLCIEGEKGSAIKSMDYKNLYKKTIERESAMYLFDFLITPRVVTRDLQLKYYSDNKAKFPNGFENAQQRIIETLKKNYEKQISALGNKWLDSVSHSYGVEYNDNIFKRVASFNFITKSTLADSLNVFSESELSSAIIVCKKFDRKVTLSYLVKALKEIPPFSIASFRDINKLKAISNGSILNSILTLEAEKNKLTDNPEVIKMTREHLKPNLGIIQESINFADEKYIPSKSEMIKYFNENNQSDKDLWCKRKMKTWEIFKPFDDADQDSTNDKIRIAIELENILQSVKNGEDFEKYARLYHRKMSENGFLFWVFKEDFGLVGETAFNMKAGEVSELIYHPKAISIIKVTEVNESRSYAYEYVEEIIKQKLINSKKKQARMKMQKDFNKKYKVKFFI